MEFTLLLSLFKATGLFAFIFHRINCLSCLNPTEAKYSPDGENCKHPIPFLCPENCVIGSCDMETVENNEITGACPFSPTANSFPLQLKEIAEIAFCVPTEQAE